MKIPKYIIKDIEQITKYAERMEPLILIVDEWYSNQMSEYKKDIPDEWFEDISSNERGLKEFNLSSIKENFRILDEQGENK